MTCMIAPEYFAGTVSDVFEVGHLISAKGARIPEYAALDPDYALRLYVAANPVPIDRIVTAKNTENTHYLAQLTAADTNLLGAGDFTLILRMTNPSKPAAFPNEHHIPFRILASVLSEIQLVASFFANVNTFPAHALTSAVTLAVPLFTDGDTFLAHTLTSIASLTLPLFMDGDTFPSHALTSTRTLAVPLFIDGDTFPAHALTITTTLAVPLFTDGDTFPAHVLTSGGLPVRFAATRARGLLEVNLVNKQVLSRTAHVAKDAIDRVKLAYGNFRLRPGASTEDPLGGAATLTVAVEYPAGTRQRITWDGGANSKTIANAALEFTDWSPAGLGIPAGATFWLLVFWDSPTGILYNAFRNTALGETTQVAANGLVDQTLTGNITSSGNFTLPPLAILAETGSKCALILGDSKSHGLGDAAESATNSGPGLRGQVAKSFNANTVSVNVATGGSRANLWATQWTQRRKLLPFASAVYISIGHNDVYVSGDSAAVIETNVEAIISDVLAVNPTAKIVVGTQAHKSTSTDSWATTVNQAPAGGNADRTAYNDRVRALQLVGQTHFMEISDQVETARGSSLWKVNGGPNYATADGVHETAAGYDLIVAAAVVPLPDSL